MNQTSEALLHKFYIQPELKEIAKGLGIPITGTKAQLCHRIAMAQSKPDQSASDNDPSITSLKSPKANESVSTKPTEEVRQKSPKANRPKPTEEVRQKSPKANRPKTTKQKSLEEMTPKPAKEVSTISIETMKPKSTPKSPKYMRPKSPVNTDQTSKKSSQKIDTPIFKQERIVPIKPSLPPTSP